VAPVPALVLSLVLYRFGMQYLARLAVAALSLTLLIPGTGVLAQAPSPSLIVLEPVAEAGYGIGSVAPVGWTSVGMGIRTRGLSPADPTLLGLQSAPVQAEQLWPALLPQLGLTSRPDAIETRSTPVGLDWSLYQVPAAGTIADLGLADGDGASYLVLLLSPQDEAASLRSSVFLPAIDAYAPLPDASPTPPSAAYTDKEVTFPGGSAGVTLAGTLSVPTTPGPHGAVVLMTGSGPQDRDESLPGMTLKPFALLARALAEAGVTVLRYDDRGTAASTGDYAAATLADFTADGAAALAYLRGRTEVDPARTGVLGHSEGGVYIADIAAHDPDVAFVVGLAPVARPGVDLLVDQAEAIARSQGGTVEQIAAARSFASRLYAAGLAGVATAAETILREYFGDLYDGQDPASRQVLGDREDFIQGQVDGQLATLKSPWFLSLLRSDAGRDWSQVSAPTLGVFGGKDVQVIAALEAPAMQAALDAAGNTDVTIVTLGDANHLFQTATTGAVGEYSSLEQAFAPDLMPLVVGWVVEHAGIAP